MQLAKKSKTLCVTGARLPASLSASLLRPLQSLDQQTPAATAVSDTKLTKTPAGTGLADTKPPAATSDPADHKPPVEAGAAEGKAPADPK